MFTQKLEEIIKKITLKDDIQDKRERVPFSRYNGWFGLVLKILVFVVVLYVFYNFTTDNAERMLWFMRGGK